MWEFVSAVHPQLSEQAELNLKTGGSYTLIIEDGLLTLFHAP